MVAIFKREVKSYFNSPVAYVLIGMFVLLSSIVFTLMNLNTANPDNGNFTSNLTNMWFLLIFILPLLTMKSIAEERKNGTEVLLVTAPVTVTSIVLAKFLAVFFVFMVMTVISFIYPVLLIILGGSFSAQLLGAYIGFILLGASMIAVGIFASSLTENQIISALVSFVSLIAMLFAGSLGDLLGGTASKILNWFSLFSRYDDFSRGILSLSPIIYYLSFIFAFIFLTVMVIQRRRWSQG